MHPDAKSADHLKLYAALEKIVNTRNPDADTVAAQIRAACAAHKGGAVRIETSDDTIAICTEERDPGTHATQTIRFRDGRWEALPRLGDGLADCDQDMVVTSIMSAITRSAGTN